jgi:hypothetical protein
VLDVLRVKPVFLSLWQTFAKCQNKFKIDPKESVFVGFNSFFQNKWPVKRQMAILSSSGYGSQKH